MVEFDVLRQLLRTYRRLQLGHARLLLVLLVMACTALLEMIGLSILYPLVLALGTQGSALAGFWVRLPEAIRPASDPRSQLLYLIVLVAGVNVAKNIALYFSTRYNIRFAIRYHRNLIAGLYAAYLGKPLGEFRKQSAGELNNLICVQSARLIDGVIRPLLVVVGELVLLLAIMAVVFATSPVLGVTVIASCGVAVGLYYLILRHHAHRWGHRRLESASLLHELVNITVGGVTEIKIFGKEAFLASRVREAAREETSMFEKLEMYQQAPRFVLESMFVLSFLAVFAVFLWLGLDLTVLLAKFSVIVAAMFRLLPCMNRLVNSYSNFSFNLGPAALLLREIDRLPATPAATPPASLASRFAASTIQLRDVWFHHATTPDRSILRGVDLAISQGQRVGIAGASGSGKSTLVEVLAALHAPTRGQVLVDGTDVAADPAGWQAAIGYVPQTPFILPGTIRENISFRSNDPQDDALVWQTLDQVGLGPFVRTLTTGLDTRIGEKGMGLSGGQRQLICLARALFRQPKILLLDEPTAALDATSEATVLTAVNQLPRATAVVMISHKPDNFRHFDQVYHCNQGRLQSATVPFSPAS